MLLNKLTKSTNIEPLLGQELLLLHNDIERFAKEKCLTLAFCVTSMNVFSMRRAIDSVYLSYTVTYLIRLVFGACN